MPTYERAEQDKSRIARQIAVANQIISITLLQLAPSELTALNNKIDQAPNEEKSRLMDEKTRIEEKLLEIFQLEQLMVSNDEIYEIAGGLMGLKTHYLESAIKAHAELVKNKAEERGFDFL